MMNKRHFQLTLVALIATQAFTSCGGTSTDSETVQTQDSETIITETGSSYIDDLPEMNFSGREFRVLATDGSAYRGYIDVSETNGDILNDSIYESNRSVEDRFNAVIKQEIVPRQESGAIALKVIAAGDDEYEIISLIDRYALQQAAQGMLISYADIPYIDLDRDYWSKSINESIRMGGEQYLAYGDFNLSAYDMTCALAFNKQLIDELGLDDPYELVDSGKWTFDAFNMMATAAVKDLNGDTKMDENDRYGWTADIRMISPSMWVAAGVQSIKKDNDDFPYFSMVDDEKFQEVFVRIVDIAYNNNVWYKSDKMNGIINNPMFSNGNSLFQTTSFGELDKGYYRNMKIDYGVLPNPKWDEEQDSYYSRVEGARIFVIPKTTLDTEFTGVMLEATSASAHETVIPSYFEVSLKTKYTRDEESIKMFDIIMDSRVYDLGDTFWCEKIRDGFILKLFKAGSKDISSAIASNKKSIASNINDTIEGLKNE